MRKRRVAGRDIPNAVFNDRGDQGVDITFSVDPESEFVPPSLLGEYARWAAPAMKELIEVVQGWYAGEIHDLFELNAQIEALHDKMGGELEQKFGHLVAQNDRQNGVGVRQQIGTNLAK